MSQLHGIKVISFDLWLTLIMSNPTPNRATRAQAMYEIFGIESLGITFDSFKLVVKDIEKFADVTSENGEKHYGPYERTLLVAQYYGVTMMDDAGFKKFYAEQFERFTQFPPQPMQDDVVDVLQQLSGKYRLALMSNTGFVNGAEMRPVLKAIGMLDKFTYQIFSDEVGVNKPHPRIFQHLLTISGANAQDVLHIGDNRSADYDGARAAGLHAIHLPSTMTVREAVSSLL